MIPAARGRTYCRSRLKRAFDLCVAAGALVVLAAPLGLLALLLLVVSGRPILFRQERVGLDGRTFRILKFRTMRPGAEAGLPITGRGDARITAVGRILRATKLDELPQVINVARGEMSIVGPRPEVPRYVALYGAEQRRVLEARPGLTDPASVLFRDEESLLASLDAKERERFYIERVLPRKLALNLEYIEQAGFWNDLLLILRTLRAVVLPARQ